MVIVQINGTYKIGSTGKIMSDLNDVIEEYGFESYMVCAYSVDKDVPNLYVMEHIKYDLAVRKNLIISRFTGMMGYRQERATKKMVEWVKEKNPDVVHLHNIHGDWLNIHVLFDYLKTSNVKVVWTLHDCWSFTGRCSHFELAKCDKWKTGCHQCTNNKIYPISYFFDFSKKMYTDKKNDFTGLNNLVIVTPSEWLANYVKQSFLSDYPIKTIHNGIDLNIFFPRKECSSYLSGCYDKKIILGVASTWTKNKGLLDIYKLNELIDNNTYQIVLVGLNTRQLQEVPKNIIAIGRTNNQEELAELYSNASVFINPTYLDNYPTTNLEAIACGTPVITYKTGGSVESVDKDTGIVVELGDVEGIVEAIGQIEKSETLCVEHAKEYFNKHDRYIEYIGLYKK